MKKVFLLVKFFLLINLTLFAQFDVSKIDDIVKKSLCTEGPGGSLLIKIKGETVYNKAFGFSDTELKTKNTTGTVFQIGSISKQMTAVGILLLVEEGKLNLTDPVTKFIPDFIEPASKVTIEHLLLHNSGIQSYTSSPKWNPAWESQRSITETIDLIKNEPFDFNPGEKFQYNNSGYIILAYIIEETSGMNFGDFMKERVFAPLGMNKTRHGNSKEELGSRAEGFSLNVREKKLNKSVYTEFEQLSGAGSFVSTVGDMLIWDEAVKSQKLLSAENWNKALSPLVKTNWGETHHYGYGWVIQDFYGHKLVWHNGGMPGFLSSYYRFPEDELTIILLTNSDFSSSEDIVNRIAKSIFGIDEYKLTPAMLPNGALAKYEGTYIYSQVKCKIELNESGKLVIRYPDFAFPELTLIPTSLDTLYESTLTDLFFVVKEFEDGIPVAGEISDMGKKVKFFREGYEPKFELTEISTDELKKYEGTYEFAPGAVMDVYIKNSELKAFLKGQPEYTLEFMGEHRFQLKGLTGFFMIFDVNENSVAVGVTSSQPNGDFKAKKK